MLFEQELPVDEEVVEVHGIGVALALAVFAEDGENLLLVESEVGEVLLEMQLQRGARIEQKRVDVEEDIALRKALLEGVDAGGGDGGLHHLLGVFVVEDGEVRAIADGVGVAAEEAVADGVEGAAPDASISREALLVNVRRRISEGSTPSSMSRDTR